MGQYSIPLLFPMVSSSGIHCLEISTGIFHFSGLYPLFYTFIGFLIGELLISPRCIHHHLFLFPLLHSPLLLLLYIGLYCLSLHFRSACSPTLLSERSPPFSWWYLFSSLLAMCFPLLRSFKPMVVPASFF